MTRRDICRECNELLGAQEPICVDCGWSFCFECTQYKSEEAYNQHFFQEFLDETTETPPTFEEYCVTMEGEEYVCLRCLEEREEQERKEQEIKELKETIKNLEEENQHLRDLTKTGFKDKS